KTALETLDGLRRERDFRDENDCAAPAIKRRPDRLQIDFGFSGTGHTMEQNWMSGFRRGERLGDFVQCARLLEVQNKIGRGDELLIRVRIAPNSFFTQLCQTSFDQRARGLIIERCLAQEL